MKALLFLSLLSFMACDVSAQCKTAMKTLAITENEDPDASINDLNQNFTQLAQCIQNLQSENRRLSGKIETLNNTNRSLINTLNDSLQHFQQSRHDLIQQMQDLRQTRLGNLKLEGSFSSGTTHAGKAESDGFIIAFAEATAFGTQGNIIGDMITEEGPTRISIASISWTDQTLMRYSSIMLPIQKGQEWSISYNSDIGDEENVSLRTLWLSFASE